MVQSVVLTLEGVSVRRDGGSVLSDVDWCVASGERWVVLGPNGAGKTTMMHVASTYLGPTAGGVTVLGQRIGTVDVRELRPRIGYVGAALLRLLPSRVRAIDLVAMGRDAKLQLIHERPDAETTARAEHLLAEVGCAHRRDTPFAHLSVGEQQRVSIARSLMPNPEILLLDEPTAGLDVAGREQLIATLERLADLDDVKAIVLVTHHLEEIPRGFTHAFLLRAGRVVEQGAIDQVVASRPLSEAFGIPLDVHEVGGRFLATADRTHAVS